MPIRGSVAAMPVSYTPRAEPHNAALGLIAKLQAPKFDAMLGLQEAESPTTWRSPEAKRRGELDR